MPIYHFEGCRFDSSDGRLWQPASGRERSLRPRLARLFEHFLRHPGRVLDRDSLCRAVWPEGTVIDFDAGLASLLKELRQTLDAFGLASHLETLPRRGWRLNLRLESMPGSIRPAPRPWTGTAFVLAALAGTLVLLALAFRPEPAALGPRVPALAVAPLERFGDPDALPEHAGILLADTLLARLWELDLPDLVLVGRSSLEAYRDHSRPMLALAEDLDVQMLLEGSLLAQHGGWMIELRLIAIPGGRLLWSASLAYADMPVLPVAAAARELAKRFGADWPNIQSQLSGTP